MALEQYALVNDKGIVVNVCTWDGKPDSWTPPPGATVLKATAFPTCAPGDQFDGVTLTKAPESPLDGMNRVAASLTAKANQALTSNAAYLALTPPTTGQAVAQVASLTRQVNALIKLTIRALQDESGT